VLLNPNITNIGVRVIGVRVGVEYTDAVVAIHDYVFVISYS
jgi:hypothetical protein